MRKKWGFGKIAKGSQGIKRDEKTKHLALPESN